MINYKYKLQIIGLLLLLSALACDLNSMLPGSTDASLPQDVQSDSLSAASPAVPFGEAQTPVPSPGEVYSVDPNGLDENDGSLAAPWLTIQHAVDSVAPGDTIMVQSGTYEGARIERSGNADAWITLQAAPGASVLINAPGSNNKHESILEIETWEGDEIVAFWVIEGLEVSDAPNWGIDLRGNEENHSHDFIIRNNLVHDNGFEGGNTGIFFAFIDDVIVEGNESYNNGEHGIYLSNSGDRFVVRGNELYGNNNCGLHINGDLESGEDGIISDGLIENNIIYENGVGGCAGINMDGVTDAIVHNNLLYENHATGIALFQENGTVCSQNIQILNNTIVQAEDARWAIYISDDECINNKIFNNIILTSHEWRGSIVISASGITGFESDHNVIMDRFSADDDESVISLSEWQALGYDVNSVIASIDEIFAGSEDFHLIPASPAVDAGLTLPGLTIDLEGILRPQGAGYDIGAFEYGEMVTQPEATAAAADLQSPSVMGTITYTFDGSIFRIAAQEGAEPENISQALDLMSSGGGDGHLNVSPDGEWLVLDTERFDPECVDWSCLAVIEGDLSSGDVIRANGEVIHSGGGISAVASGGNLVIYSADDGPHEVDLWAVTRTADAWSTPLPLTADSPMEFNYLPAVSDDGSTVVFNCGPQPYGGEGTAICEVGTDGTGFRVVLTPADAPAGFPTTGALHQPDYAPDGSFVFESDWGSEQIWHLQADTTEPALISSRFGNDNSPCVLPDGRIVSLWLDRQEGSGAHEIKVMASDGRQFIMLLPDVDVLDDGMGCGQ